MSHHRTHEQRSSDERYIKMLQNDLDVILAKYHELGHALTNMLIDSAIKHLVHRIKPDFFDGLGYLSYRMNDYYLSEVQTKEKK